MQMREAVDAGYSDRLTGLIDEVVVIHPEMAHELRGIAEEYQYDALSDLLGGGPET